MKIKKREVQSEDGGLFLKFKDGDKFRGVCRGEIFEFQTLWANGKSTVVKSGGKPRFKVNFVTEEKGALVAKIWEFGITVYNQLASLDEVLRGPDFNVDLERAKILVSRSGSTKDDTTYPVVLIKALDPVEAVKVSAVKLNILGEKQTADDLSFLDDGPPPVYDGPDIPF